MSKIKKIFIVGVVFLFTISIAACSKEKVEEIFDSKKIKVINISTQGNNIIFLTSDNDNIKVSLEDYDSTLGNIKGGVLSILIPEPEAGINVSVPKPIYIYLPEKQYENITAYTKTGDVQIQDIDVLNLNLASDHGEIQLSNMSGTLEAAATMGSIETELEIVKDIVKDKTNLMQKLSGEIGEENKKNIKLKTNTGKIILNK